MAMWLIPALKAVLPHIGTIISATAPAFTKKGAAPTTDQTQLLQQQISELQAAASQNATHVKELAEQLQRTVAAIEEAFRKLADEATGGKLGKVAQPVRLALTGTTVSPSLFEVISILGREEVIRRLDRALSELGKSA